MLRKEIYELPQLPLFLSKFRFSLLAILYVRPGCIPTNDLAVSIQQGVVANQEPAVATVFSASTLLVFKWNRAGKGAAPLLTKPLNVVRMEYTLTKIIGAHFLDRQSHVFQRHAICVNGFPFRI